MSTRTKYTAFAVLIPAALVLSGCMTQTPQPPPVNSGQTVEQILQTGNITNTGVETPPIVTQTRVFIMIKDSAFVPQTRTIKVGSKVTWTNNDNTSHTISGDRGFASGPLSQGESYSYTFTQAGTYSYICSTHPNMKGTIVVMN